MFDVPETPEGVALMLLCLILNGCGANPGSNQTPAQQILGLFGECLRAARGGEDVSHGSRWH